MITHNKYYSVDDPVEIRVRLEWILTNHPPPPSPDLLEVTKRGGHSIRPC